jgi:tRNA (uracil-5-)-methyltransferase TRM9
MRTELASRLLALNRRFYSRFAQSFSDTRTLSDPSLTCILPYMPLGATVLDVGCGNGRLAALLDMATLRATYLGLDVVPELVDIARIRARDFSNTSARYLAVDISSPGWETSPKLQGQTWDRVVCLALLHHLPSYRLRSRIVGEMASLVSPDGSLIVSVWQFTSSDRMMRKVVSWDTIGVRRDELEPDDYLIRWQRGGSGLRYCHAVDEAEIHRLARDNGLEIHELFHAGGREGTLGLFAILVPPHEPL